MAIMPLSMGSRPAAKDSHSDPDAFFLKVPSQTAPNMIRYDAEPLQYLRDQYLDLLKKDADQYASEV